MNGILVEHIIEVQVIGMSEFGTEFLPAQALNVEPQFYDVVLHSHDNEHSQSFPVKSEAIEYANMLLDSIPHICDFEIL